MDAEKECECKKRGRTFGDALVEIIEAAGFWIIVMVVMACIAFGRP